MDYLQTKGRIFNIQRFSIHDGPGIRTIVFFKGCFMRCAWCCNPESQEFEIQTMMEKGSQKTVGKDISVSEILPEILSDQNFYKRSGGGVTLSGGEVLAQPKFAKDLLRACKDNGLHTAVESTGNADFKVINELLPYVDLFLLDVKHIDSKKHKEYTLFDNELILENAKKLANSNVELIIRTPIIPTFNDTDEEIRAISKFVSELNGVKELHLLPYHNLGVDKHLGLNKKYTLLDITPPPKEQMEAFKLLAEEYGLKVQIGG